MPSVFFVLAGASALALAGQAATRGLSADRPATRATASPATAKTEKVPFTLPQGYSVIAKSQVKRLPVYARRGGTSPVRFLGPRNASGGPLVLLVDWRQRRWTWDDWVRVYLPMRPNGSKGWIRSRDVLFKKDPFRVEVDLSAHRITIWKGARVFLKEPVGVGRAVTPTPVGRYFITELIISTNPRGLYGPYAFGTSAFSHVLTSFGGGPGQVGIHGTNQPELIGTDVSHGCIRLRNDVISRLAKVLPLGTPVSIER